MKRFFELFRGSRKLKIQTFLGLAVVLALLVGAVVMKTNEKLAAAEVSGNSSETTVAAPLPESSMDGIMPRASTAGVFLNFKTHDIPSGGYVHNNAMYLYYATVQSGQTYAPVTLGGAFPSAEQVYEQFKVWYKTLPDVVTDTAGQKFNKFPIKEGKLKTNPDFIYYSSFSMLTPGTSVLIYPLGSINYDKVMSGSTTSLGALTSRTYFWDQKPTTVPATEGGKPTQSVIYMYGDIDTIMPSSVSPKEVTKPFGYPAYGGSGSWSWTPTANELKDWVTVQDDSGNTITNYSVQLKNATNVNTGKVGETSYTVTVTYTDNNETQSEDVDVPVRILPAEMRVANGNDGHFTIGAGQPSADTLKSDYFTGKVDMVSVNADGSQAGVLESAIGTVSYSTTLKSPTWNSSGNPNPVTYKVDVTYDYTSGKYYNVLKNRTVQVDWKAYYQQNNPLRIEFTKYQEDGKTPLAGAKFVMQRQLESSGKWALMSPAAANGNVVFTTNAQGKIIISESENKAFWDSMKKWGGNSENKQFRFREISAPSGYEQPPGYDVSDPMQESDSDSALAPFVTEAFFVDSKTTGTIERTLTNKKAKLIVALHKVNESGDSLPGAVLVLQSQRRDEQNNWSTVVTAGLTSADVTFTTDAKGYAYLPEKLIDNMRTYGKNYEYRFREITAPSGYAPAPAYSGGKEDDGSPAGFVSEVFQVDGTTTENQTIEVVNYKEQVDPLKVVLQKYQEDGKTPLAGATFEFQSRKENGTWQKFVVANDTTNYTTDAKGQIVLDSSVLDSIKTYGGEKNDTAFRFAETSAPAGYVAPTGDKGSDSYAFATEVKELTKATTGTQIFPFTNQKEKEETGITLKVTMIDAVTKEPISFPAGTTQPLSLFDKTMQLSNVSSVSGSTVTFAKKIEKNVQYRISQDKSIPGYQKYNADNSYDTGTGANQTPYLGVDANGNPMFETIPVPTDDWITKMGVSIKYDKSSLTLEVRISNKKEPSYILKQLKVPEETYNAGIDALEVEDWTALFTGSQQLAVVDKNNGNEVKHYLEKNDFTPELISTWDSSPGPRSFNIRITPTSSLISKYSGLSEITAQAKLTFEDVPEEAYQFKIIVRNQNGEPANFAANARPFEAIQVGQTVWEQAVINSSNQTLVEFSEMEFLMDTQYRVRQIATPDEDYSLWANGNQTKAFQLENGSTLSVSSGDGEGNVGTYNIANQEVTIADGWSARYDTSTETLTFYFVNEEEMGALTLYKPDDMDFGEVKTPVRQAEDKFLQEKWQIVVSDTRKKNRNQWNITAQLTTPLTNTVNQKQLAKDILKYKSTNGTVYDLSKPADIYQSATNPALGDTPITSDSTHGFYLDLISNGYYPVGKYQGTVTFTLSTTP